MVPSGTDGSNHDLRVYENVVAIVESGGSSIGGGGITLRTRTLADAEADGRKFAESKNAQTLEQMRALSWQQLIAPGGPRFSPVVDGYVIPAPVREVTAQGKQNDLPTLTGAHAGELGGLMPAGGAVTLDRFVTRARRQYGTLADEFLKLYPASNDAEAAAAQVQSSRDQALVSMYLWAKERAATSKARAFLYLWDHTLPGPDAAKFGAFHTSEVPYVLNTLPMSDRPFTDADRRISAMMSSYWANFAATGDPNGEGLVQWNAVGDIPEVMELGDDTRPVPAAASAAKSAFFRKFLTGIAP